MSKTEEIYEFFNTYITSLKETSCDDSNLNDIKYMSESALPVIHFDGVKALHYAPLRGLTKENRNLPCSCDALLLDKEGLLNLIEFKNTSSAQNLKAADLKEKAYCSVIMLSDTFNLKISELASLLNLVIVCNKDALFEKRRAEQAKRDRENRKNLQESSSFNCISQTALSFGNGHIISLGLDSLKTFCFNDVYTLTKEEFEAHLQKIQIQAS